MRIGGEFDCCLVARAHHWVGSLIPSFTVMEIFIHCLIGPDLDITLRVCGAFRSMLVPFLPPRSYHLPPPPERTCVFSLHPVHPRRYHYSSTRFLSLLSGKQHQLYFFRFGIPIGVLELHSPPYSHPTSFFHRHIRRIVHHGLYSVHRSFVQDILLVYHAPQSTPPLLDGGHCSFIGLTPLKSASSVSFLLGFCLGLHAVFSISQFPLSYPTIQHNSAIVYINHRKSLPATIQDKIPAKGLSLSRSRIRPSITHSYQGLRDCTIALGPFSTSSPHQRSFAFVFAVI